MAQDFSPWSDDFVRWFQRAQGSQDADLTWERLTEALLEHSAAGGGPLYRLVAVFSDDEGLMFVTKALSRRVAREWRTTVAEMEQGGRLFAGRITNDAYPHL